jgi:predicted transcriptional regulator
MQRTQIYLDERQVARLKAVARATRRTVSQVIREAINDKLARPAQADDFDRALAGAAGLWAKRTDLGPTDEYVRRVRTDRRGVFPL